MSKDNRSGSGKTAIMALVVLVIAAVGALAFLSGQIKVSQSQAENAGSQAAAAAVQEAASAGETAAAQASPAAGEGKQGEQAEAVTDIEPGNPVVARVDGQEITRVDVLEFMQQLPPNMRDMPLQQIFPMALNQVVNNRVIEAKTASVNLDDSEEVQKQLEEAKKQIVRNVFINQKVDEAVDEKKLKAAYDEYVKNFPKIQEVKASHILVEDEDKAKELIGELNEGASFEELAKENSTDGTAENGGSLGFFAKEDVVPEFSQAAFNLKPGEYTKEPVKTQFGYHIIKSEEKRQRPPADFEQARPFLEAQLRRQALEDIIRKWREETKVQTFDINGKPVEEAESQ